MNLEKLCIENGVKIKSRQCSKTDKTNDRLPPGTSHWKSTLFYQGRRLTVDFYMGPAHVEAPTATDVVYSLCIDAAAGEMGFFNFCDDYDYDSDSRKAEQIYKECERMAPKLRRLLGDDFDLFASAEY